VFYAPRPTPAVRAPRQIAPERKHTLASETRPLLDEHLPEEVTIEGLSQDAYDDPDSRDIFAKTRKFTISRLAKMAGYYPFYNALDSNEGPEAIINGQRVLMLGSNNYLGLTRHPRVVKAARDAVERYGTSMTGSRLLNGTTTLHLRLEELLAQFLGTEGCLTFTTGYQANLGAISSLVNRRAVAVIDKADHASIYDGCALADGEMRRFLHNDIDDLERVLAKETQTRAALVVVDGVFSMEGDIAPLPQIVEVCKRHEARLLLDDAHSIGVLGKGGRGTASHYGLEKEVDLTFGTFSKSLASIGGFIAGPEDVMEWMRHFARSMVFSASAPPAQVVAAITALEVLMDEPELVDKVNANAVLLRDGLRAAGFNIGHSETPIVPIRIGDERKTVGFWRELLKAGIYTNASIYPAVPQGAAILRTSCMATHEPEQIKKAVATLAELGNQFGITTNN
jgi:8-amino-7-oxononanoate synthase